MTEAEVPLVSRYAPDVEGHLSALEILRQAEHGAVTETQIRQLLIGEFACQQAEIPAYALLVARFPDERFASYFIAVQQSLLAARESLLRCGERFALSRDDFVGSGLPPGVERFTGLVSWLAIHGGPGETALVTRNDWLLYCAACEKLAKALERAGQPELEPAISYLQGYATVPDLVRDGTHQVVAQGLSCGELEASVGRSVHLVEPALRAFWRGVGSAGH